MRKIKDEINLLKKQIAEKKYGKDFISLDSYLNTLKVGEQKRKLKEEIAKRKAEIEKLQGSSTKRVIDTIVIHHAPFTDTSEGYEVALEKINREHSKYANLSVPQEQGGTRFPNIAYHYAILNGDIIETRDIEKIGYHAGNWETNLTSVGIVVLGGNYEKENPTPLTIDTLNDLVSVIMGNHNIIKMGMHNDFRNTPTLCCGKNLERIIGTSVNWWEKRVYRK